MLTKRIFGVLALILAAALSACGGGSLGSGEGDPDGGSVQFGYIDQGTFNDKVIGMDEAEIAANASTTLKVDLIDSAGKLLTGTSAKIVFTSDCVESGLAQVDPASSTTTEGSLEVIYTAQGCTGDDDITATATVSGSQYEAYGTVAVLEPGSVYRAGLIEDGAFTEGKLGVGVEELSAGGTAALTIDIVDETGARANGITATASFSSECLVSNLASAPNLTTTTGRVNATYTAQGCQGQDAITGTVGVAGNSLNVTGALTVLAPELGSIKFISADPEVIGMSGSTISGQSTVTFQVFDVTGNPLNGQTVTFNIDGTAGGALLTPTSGVSSSIDSSSGIVTTRVNAGSTHTVVRVRATAVSPVTGLSVTTQSDQLVISTGFSDQNSFSLAANKLSVTGLCDGEPVAVSIRAADRYNNPVPDNTAITFTTEGGKVTGQCFTGTSDDDLPEAGVCSTLLTVQNPRPANGRATVLATARGEETFNDTNGNGFYDASETYTDLPEAFVDENENDLRDSNEPFSDFNGNGSYDGPDGAFTGYVCDSPGVNCGSTTLDNRNDIVIVFSTDTPLIRNVVVTPGSEATYSNRTKTLTLSSKLASAAVTMKITDTNGNPLPTGTTYELQVSGGAGVPSAELGPFNTNSTTPLDLNYSISAPNSDDPAAGTASLVVHLPASACDGGANIATPLFNVVYEGA